MKNAFVLRALALTASLSAFADRCSIASEIVSQIHTKPVFTTFIEWVGTNEPPEAESQVLLKTLNVFDSGGPAAGFVALQNFLDDYPKSAWAPSLHASIAECDRNLGRYSLALNNWRIAWEATRDSRNPRSQRVAARTIANWTRLLASLGRKDELDALFAEMDQRHLPLGPYGVLVEGTRGGLAMMNAKPSESYRCGSFALGHVGQAMHAAPEVVQRLFLASSPDGGFTMEQLVRLAATNGFEVEALKRPPGADLVVPSVVHWRLNHYAAIIQRSGDRYEVVDPTFERRVWMSSDAINEEASDAFLIPKGNAPASWSRVGALELASIVGKGGPDDVNHWDDGPPTNCDQGDGQDSDCDPPSANDGASSGGGPTPPPPPCCDGSDDDGGDTGMPQWRISEPYETLWLHDTPIRYRLSSGKWAGLHLTYKHQGEIRPAFSPGFGNKWSFNWQGILENASTNSPGTFTDYMAGGGIQYFTTNANPDYKTARVLIFESNSIPVLLSPTGSKNRYSYIFGYSGSAITNYFLSQRLDRYGRTVQLNYTNSGGYVQLLSVTDLDGRATTFGYANTSFPNLITSVTNPYQQTAYFGYDTQGQLTKIVDAAGMTNTLSYDANDNVITLVTPYGTNSFQYMANTNSSNGMRSRGVLVTEASGDQQLYTYTDNTTNNSAMMPTPGDGVGNYRLSYHWNRAQYAAVSPTGKANPLNMPDQDYQVAELKHWLHGPNVSGPPYTVSDTLDSLAGPFDTVLGRRPNTIAYAYMGQNTMYPQFIGYSTNGALQRATSVLINGSQTFSATYNTVGRPLIRTYFVGGNPMASYTNIFDSSGRYLLQEWGPRGELVRGYGYHPVITNLLTSVTNAVGDVVRYVHDTNTMKVISITFPSGLIRSNFYFASGLSQGFLQSRIDVGFRTNYYTYTNGNVAVRTNELGLVFTNAWDKLNRFISRAYPDGTSLSNIYNNLDIVGVKDRLNQWTHYQFNAVRQLIAATNVNSQLIQYSYCGCGSPNQVTRWNGPNALVTQLLYDAGGRLTNTTYPDGYQLNRVYDANGNLQSITDTSGRHLNLSFVQLGTTFSLSQAHLVSPNQGESYLYLSYLYDEYGRATNSIDHNGVTTAKTYDFLNRPLSRQFMGYSLTTMSGQETFKYNSRGLTNYTDPLGHFTTFVRDALDRSLFETNANNELLQFKFDPADKLVVLVDGKNQPTSWTYDQYSRVTSKVDALGTNSFVYAYDANGRLISRTSAAKGTTVYQYDPIGNLTNVCYPVSGTNSFKFDGLNRLVNIVDKLGTTTFTWTPGDQLASETGPWADDTISYTYTSRQRSSLSLIQPNDSPWTQTYLYDEFARLTNVTSRVGSFGYQYPYIWVGQYTAADLISEVTYPSGAHNDRSYDDLGELLSTTLYGISSSTILDQHSYAYNQGLQRTKQTFQAGNFMNYGYDNIGQLTSAQGFESSGATRLHEQFGYAYDKAWNLSNRTNNALVETFGANVANELSSVGRSGNLTVAGTTTSPSIGVNVSGTGISGSQPASRYSDNTWALGGVSLANGQNMFTANASDSNGRSSQSSVTVNLPTSSSITYDANGNLLSDGNRNFAYDDDDELTSLWVTNAWRSDFIYDGIARRRVRREYVWSGGTWLQTNEVHYAYDRLLVIQERDAYNIPQVSYTLGNDLSGTSDGAGGIGALLARTEMGQPLAISSLGNSYYHADGNGNITCLINSSNSLMARYSYDAFGNILSKIGKLSDRNLYRFSSKEFHEQSGTIFYLHRVLDPNLQRWLFRDPLGNRGGINSFGFVSNEPIDVIDPLGLCNWGQVTAGGVQVAGGIVAAVGLSMAEAPTLGAATIGFPTVFFGITHGLMEIGTGISDDPTNERAEAFLHSYPSNGGGAVGFALTLGDPNGVAIGDFMGGLVNLSFAENTLISDFANGANLTMPSLELSSTLLESVSGGVSLANTLSQASPSPFQHSAAGGGLLGMMNNSPSLPPSATFFDTCPVPK